MRFTTIAAAMLVVLFSFSIAFACGQGMRGGHGMMMHKSTMPNDARLSSDQQKKIEDIRAEFTGRFTDLQKRIRNLNVEIADEFGKESPDVAKLKSLRQKRNTTWDEIQKLHQAMNEKINGVLNDQQRAYFGDHAFCHGSMGGGHGMKQQHHSLGTEHGTTGSCGCPHCGSGYWAW